MSVVELDKFDRAILGQLQIDTSASVEKIAEHVGLSRNACWRRIKQLDEAGVIQSRVAILDPDKLGLTLLAYVHVRTSNHDMKWTTQFRKVIRSMPEIISAHRMSGDLDYVLRVRVASVKDYDRFYQALIKDISLSDISASFVMEDIKDTTALPV